VGLVLPPRHSEIPLALRLATTDGQAAHDRIKDTLYNDELLLLEDTPPMFAFAIPTATGWSTSRKLRNESLPRSNNKLRPSSPLRRPGFAGDEGPARPVQGVPRPVDPTSAERPEASLRPE
jgi:hypothetical protein